MGGQRVAEAEDARARERIRGEVWLDIMIQPGQRTALVSSLHTRSPTECVELTHQVGPEILLAVPAWKMRARDFHPVSMDRSRILTTRLGGDVVPVNDLSSIFVK